MNSITRKRIWPLALMPLAILGVVCRGGCVVSDGAADHPSPNRGGGLRCHH